MSTPLLGQRSDASTVPAASVDEFLALGRFGRYPGWPTLWPLLTVGGGSYALSAVLILQPTFMDDKLRAEWFADAADGAAALTAVSMAFFVLWGVGTLLVAGLSDRYGRKPALVGCISAACALSAGCAAAPSFGAYAVLRACLGAPLGGQLAVVYVLLVEWSLHADHALIAASLMAQWSAVGAATAGFFALSDGLGCGWRTQQLLLSALTASGLLAMPHTLESPRYYLTHGRVRHAEDALRTACARSGIRVPEGSSLEAVSSASTLELRVEVRSRGRGAISSGGGAISSLSCADGKHSACGADGGEPPPAHPSSRRHALHLLLVHPTLSHLLLVGVLWLAASLLFFGLDFAVGACNAANGCNRYMHAALTSLVDLPGYLAGCLLANTRLGRRGTAVLTLLLGGCCLLATACSGPTALSDMLLLLGKLCAAAAFVQAYLFPAELFATAVRGAALGVGNLFARTGTALAPLAATAPTQLVQVGLGGLAVVAALATLFLPERRGHALPD